MWAEGKASFQLGIKNIERPGDFMAVNELRSASTPIPYKNGPNTLVL